MDQEFEQPAKSSGVGGGVVATLLTTAAAIPVLGTYFKWAMGKDASTPLQEAVTAVKKKNLDVTKDNLKAELGKKDKDLLKGISDKDLEKLEKKYKVASAQADHTLENAKKDAFKQVAEDKVNETKSKLSEVNGIIESKQVELDAVKQEIKDLTGKTGPNIADELKEAKKREAQIGKDLRRHKEDLADLCADPFTKKLDDLEKSQEALQKRIDGLRKTNPKDVEAAETALKDLNKPVKEASKKVKDIESKIQAKMAEGKIGKIADLKKDLTDARKELEAAEKLRLDAFTAPGAKPEVALAGELHTLEKNPGMIKILEDEVTAAENSLQGRLNGLKSVTKNTQKTIDTLEERLKNTKGDKAKDSLKELIGKEKEKLTKQTGELEKELAKDVNKGASVLHTAETTFEKSMKNAEGLVANQMGKLKVSGLTMTQSLEKGFSHFSTTGKIGVITATVVGVGVIAYGIKTLVLDNLFGSPEPSNVDKYAANRRDPNMSFVDRVSGGSGMEQGFAR